MEETLDIKKAVDVARQSELVKHKKNNAVSGAGGHVHEVKKPAWQDRDAKKHGANFKGKHSQQRSKELSCDHCGYPQHRPGQTCPAMNKKCRNCKWMEYFNKKCHMKSHEMVQDFAPDTQQGD